MLNEDGKPLEFIFGSGRTGMRNLGNSCYMASVMQSIFSLNSFKNK
jgi:ubiquitin carboxyl-terminal hydrolase 5/13